MDNIKFITVTKKDAQRVQDIIDSVDAPGSIFIKGSLEDNTKLLREYRCHSCSFIATDVKTQKDLGLLLITGDNNDYVCKIISYQKGLAEIMLNRFIRISRGKKLTVNISDENEKSKRLFTNAGFVKKYNHVWKGEERGFYEGQF